MHFCLLKRSFLFFCFSFVFFLGAQSEYLFSPHGNITSRIIEEIDKAESEIVVAIYMITSEKIVSALIQAYQRGVIVKMVTDAGCVQSPYGKIFHLQQGGIQVKQFCPQGKNKRFPPLMHAKYAVIDQKISIEGSFNWTNSAEIWNAEHLRITNNQHHKEALYMHFNKLFNECSTVDFICHPNQIEKWNKKKEAQQKAVQKQLAAAVKKEEKERLKIEKETGCLKLVCNEIGTLLKKESRLKKTVFEQNKEDIEKRYKKKLPRKKKSAKNDDVVHKICTIHI